MSTILILPVGGSSAPVVTAISNYNPEYVVFIASANQEGRPGTRTTIDGPGNVCDVRAAQKCPHCKEEISAHQAKPAIVSQAGLGNSQYEIHEVAPDELNDCYTTCRRVLADLRTRYPHARLVADYTGGTKTMSTALVLAA